MTSLMILGAGGAQGFNHESDRIQGQSTVGSDADSGSPSQTLANQAVDCNLGGINTLMQAARRAGIAGARTGADDTHLTLVQCPCSLNDNGRRFLFRRFHRRSCIDSNWPKYLPVQFRSRFDALAPAYPAGKANNAAGLDLARFPGLDLEKIH